MSLIAFHVVACLRLAEAQEKGIREPGPYLTNLCCCCDQPVIATESSLPRGRCLPICQQCEARLPKDPMKGVEILVALAKLRVEIERSN